MAWPPDEVRMEIIRLSTHGGGNHKPRVVAAMLGISWVTVLRVLYLQNWWGCREKWQRGSEAPYRQRDYELAPTPTQIADALSVLRSKRVRHYVVVPRSGPARNSIPDRVLIPSISPFACWFGD